MMNKEFSPKELIYIFNNYINSEIQRNILIINGIYKKGSDKCYADYCYSKIKDIDDDYEMSLKIPVKIWSNLDDKGLYSFQGCIDKKINNKSEIQLTFCVTKVLSCKGKQINEDRIKRENLIKGKKIKKGYKDFGKVIREKLIDKKEVSIALIIGENAIINEDIYSSLGEYKKYYKFNEYRVTLNKKNILDILDKVKSSYEDLILLARGGGDDNQLELFNDIDIAAKISESNIMFATAIGHEINHNLAQEVSDKKFQTPTAAGIDLRDLAKEVEEIFKIKEENRQLKVKLRKDKEPIKQELQIVREASAEYNVEKTDTDSVENSNIENRNNIERMVFFVAVFIIGIIIGKYIF